MARNFLRLHFAKISLKDHAPDLLDRISVEAALQDQVVRISVEGPGQEILCRFPSSLNMVLRVYIMHNMPFASMKKVGGGDGGGLERGSSALQVKDQQKRLPRLQALFFLYRPISQSVQSLVYKLLQAIPLYLS